MLDDKFMKTVVFYFHGFGSSARTDKVAKLKQTPELDVYAFDIDIDPIKAEQYLSENITHTLIDYLYQEDLRVIFVGTSLGGWWAGKLAKQYGCKAIIINPAVSPQITLDQLGVDNLYRRNYHDLEYPDDAVFFLAEVDEVVDHTELKASLASTQGCQVFIVPGADHRFNDKFYLVQQYLAITGA